MIKDQKKLYGKVISAIGSVPGARVTAYPTDTAVMSAEIRTTDASGFFVTAVPGASRQLDIAVAPPGFAYTIGHALYSEKGVQIKVTQDGGTLVLKGSQPKHRIAVIHSDAILSLPSITLHWPSTTRKIDEKTTETTLPMMEPGDYSACAVQNWATFNGSRGAGGGVCTSGFLAPNGTLTLTVPSE